jgi:erythronate-4-phosphate dehydrogenase
MKVVADEKIPYLKGVLEPFMDVDYISGTNISAEHVKDADALIIRTRTVCNEKLLKGSGVKFIATATIGYDHIDVQYCRKHNIFWTNAPGCNSGSVKQYIASVLLNLAHQKGFKLRDKTMGIVGVGNVGRKIDSISEAFGMKVMLNDPPKERESGNCGYRTLESLIRESDILTFHTPLNTGGPDKTYHLVNDDFLSKLNPGTILINSSRGEVFDNTAVKNAIKKNVFGGLVLDVWEEEPDIDLELLEHTDIATSHIAGYSKDGKANGTAMSVRALSKFFELGILDEWQPEDVPVPEVTELNIDAAGKDNEEVMRECVNFSYNVYQDDAALRENPASFEQIRGDYPLRREFRVYTIKLSNANDELVKSLKLLGFNIIQ